MRLPTATDRLASREADAEFDNTPAYQAIATRLKRAILAGDFANGRQLPTESELAVDYQVSRQTVRKAFEQLVASSLVYRVRGRGTFATPFTSDGPYLRSMGSIDEILAFPEDSVLEVLRHPHQRADIEAAARLMLDSDEVSETMFRRLQHGDPLQITTVSLPPRIARVIGLERNLTWGASRRAGIIGMMETTPSLNPLAGAQVSITATSATAEQAELLGCEPKDPLMRIDRLYFDVTGQRVELAITYANPVRFSYRLELRRDMA
jgi:GntR family transcriptional regulator